MLHLSSPSALSDHETRSSILRCEHLSAGDFLKHFLVRNRPVILRGQLKSWPSLSRWSPSFFRSFYGDKILRFPPQADCEVRTSMREFIDALEINSPNQELMRWCGKSLPFHFPALVTDTEPTPPYFSPNWLPRGFRSKSLQSTLARGSTYEIEIGSASTLCSPLGTNAWSTHAFHLQISGMSRFHLFSPDQTRFLYPDPRRTHISTIRDIERVQFNQFPRIRRSRPISLTLFAGEILYLPNRWWHSHRFLEPSITLSCNSVNRWNWSSVTEDLLRTTTFPKRLLKRFYLQSVAARHRIIDCFESIS